MQILLSATAAVQICSSLPISAYFSIVGGTLSFFVVSSYIRSSCPTVTYLLLIVGDNVSKGGISFCSCFFAVRSLKLWIRVEIFCLLIDISDICYPVLLFLA